MRIEIDNEGCCADFIRLNELWISEHFALEEAKGYGSTLLRAAIELARAEGAQTLFLLSNTVLEPAIALYRKHGFRTVSQGAHPVYERCNIVMERLL